MGKGKKTRATKRSALLEAMEPRVLMSYTPAGPESMVNTYTPYAQSYGAWDQPVASDAQGNYVVTWHSDGQDGSGYGIYARRYDVLGSPQGSEFRVNTTTTGSQDYPNVAMDGAGNFVVVFRGPHDPATSKKDRNPSYGVLGQRFDAAGNAVGGQFRVNTFLPNAQWEQDIAMNVAGDCVVTWSSQGQSDTGYSIYAQRFGVAGQRVGGEFLVNTHIEGDQTNSSVAVDPSGAFVVTWMSAGQDGSGSGIYAQRYDPAGNRVGGEFRVNDHTASDQLHPTVSFGPGGFTIAWGSAGQDGDQRGAYAKRYAVAADGTVTSGPEFQVNTISAGTQFPTGIVYDDAGNSVVAIHQLDSTGDTSAYARKYDAAGNPVGAEFLLDSAASGSQHHPKLAAQPGASFVAVYQRPDPQAPHTSHTDVFTRRYLSDASTADAATPATSPTFSDTPVTTTQDDQFTNPDSITTEILA